MSVQWTMEKLPSGNWAGMITLVPDCDGPGALARTVRRGRPIKLVAKSRTKAGALAKASAYAAKIAANPILAAALPPGTGKALKVIAILSKSAAAGKLERAAKKLTGKGAKRLVKALKKFW